MGSIINLIEEAYLNEGAYFNMKVKNGDDPAEAKQEILDRYRNYVIRHGGQKLANAVNTLKNYGPAFIGGGAGALGGAFLGDSYEDSFPKIFQDNMPIDLADIGALVGGAGGYGLYRKYKDDIDSKFEKIPEEFINRKVEKAKEKYSGYVDPKTGKYVNLP